MKRRSVLLFALACACAGGGGTFASGASGYSSPREDRVLLTAFDDVRGVAVGQRYVFAAVPGSLVAYDRLAQRWRPPVQLEITFAGQEPYLMAADPVEEAVWVATRDRLFYHRPALDMTASTMLPSPIGAIVFDRRDLGRGAWLYDGARWWSASRVGTVALAAPGSEPPISARVSVADVRSVFDRNPALRSFAPLLARDAQMRSWPITAAAESPDASEVWLGTRGGGLFRADPAFARGERVPYGLLDEGAGALAAGGGTVWIAGLGRSPHGRSGITSVSADLQRWRWLEPRTPTVMTAARAHAIVVTGGVAWVGTARGLARIDLESERVTSWTVANGLPTDVVRAVAPAHGGAWAGTSAGLTFVLEGEQPDGAVRGPLLQGVGVHQLALHDGSLWIASDAGLLMLPAAHPDSALRVTQALGATRSATPVYALAIHDTTVFAIAGGELVRLDARTGALLPSVAALDAAVLRATSRMVADGRTLWLAGSRGVLVLSHEGAVLRRLAIPSDIPSEAYDVQLDGAFAWIATRGGVMRIRRGSGGAPL